jgi:hypothetical protein
MLAHGVETAGMKRMTTRQPAQSHPHAPDRSVPFHRFSHVTRTTRIEAARRGEQWGKRDLIQSQRPDHEPLQRWKRRSTSRCSSGKGALRAFNRGLMTMDHCGFSRSNVKRTASRNRRLMRLRMTAGPSARGTVRPMRGPEQVSRRSNPSRKQKAVNKGLDTREPRSYTLRKSCDRSRRTRFGKPAMETTFQS